MPLQPSPVDSPADSPFPLIRSLNPEQRYAWRCAVNMSNTYGAQCELISPIRVTIVEGPSGTGKSQNATAAILWFMDKQRPALVSTVTHAALAAVAGKLHQALREWMANGRASARSVDAFTF